MDAESAVLALMKIYVSRIPLVLEVIAALHPDFLMTDRFNLPIEELFALVRKYGSIPQAGIWINDEGEWRHFFHGGGCRLTHVVTGEAIDWDPPDPMCFDLWKFNYWLKWAIKTQPDHTAEYVGAIKEHVQDFHTGIDFLLSTATVLVEQGKLIKVQGSFIMRIP